MRIVFRINYKVNGKWERLGNFKELDAPTAHAAAKRIVGPKAELQTGACTIDCDKRREQWKK